MVKDCVANQERIVLRFIVDNNLPFILPGKFIELF